MTNHRVFELGDLTLQGGATLAQARIVYQTYGTLNDDRSNVILYPTSYSAQHSDIEWLIGATLAQRLIEATRLMRQVQGMLRLTVGPAFDADSGTEGLKASLARAAGMTDFAALHDALAASAREVHEIFIDTIEEPARKLGAQLDTGAKQL